MIEVEHPSGAIIEFPDGTPQDVMAKAMRQLDIPAQEQKPAGFNPVLGTLYNVAQGASMYGADEGLAGLASVGSDTTYDDALSRARGLEKQFSSEHPILAVGGQVAGAIVSPVVRAVGAAGSAAMKGARLLQGTGLATRLGQAGATGAGYGAAAGFGAGEGGLENRAESGLLGAGVGAALGPALQGAAEVAKPAGRYGAEAGRQILEAMGYGTPEKMANRALLNAISRAGTTPQDLLKQMNNSNVPLSLVDVGGPAMQRLGRAVVTQEGKGSDNAIQALHDRQMGRPDRLVNTFGQNVSPMDDATLTVEELVKARSAQGIPDYEAAMAVKPVTSENLERMLQDPLVKTGLNRGREIMRIEANARGTPYDPNDYVIGERVVGKTTPSYSERNAGAVPQTITEQTSTASPNMRALQAAKIGLDTMVEKERDPITRRLSQRGRAINELRANLLNEINTINPAYAKANQNWSDTTGLMDSVNRGRQFLRGDVDITERQIAGLTAPEKAMFRVGASRELRRLVETTRGTNDALRKFFGSPEQTRRLRALFDHDQSFANFKKVLEDEQLAQRTEQFMLGGSQTTNKAQDLEMLAGAREIPTTTSGLTASILRGAGKLAIGGARSRRAEELSPILYGTNPQKIADRLIALDNKNTAMIAGKKTRGDAGDRVRNALVAALMGNQGGND